jgi:hypothetical protein
MVWYEEGLKFKCTGCGKCCTGAPGYVWVTQEEIEIMAKKLGIAPQEFQKKYIRQIGKRISLLEDPKNYDCIFLKDKTCTLYDARPKQCRTFPFWKDNLKSKSHWEYAKYACEGIDHEDAPLICVEEIEKQLS